MLPDQRSPVGKQFCVFYLLVRRVWLQARTRDRIIPTLKVATDFVLGDAGLTSELAA